MFHPVISQSSLSHYSGLGALLSQLVVKAIVPFASLKMGLCVSIHFWFTHWFRPLFVGFEIDAKPSRHHLIEYLFRHFRGRDRSSFF